MLRIAAIAMFIAALSLGCESQGEFAGPDDDDSGGDDDSAVLDDDDTTEDGPITGVSWRLHDEIETLVYVTWTQSDDAVATVEYRFEGDDWMHTPQVALAAGEHEALLLGIPYETDVTFRVVHDPDDEPATSAEHTATTGAWPDGLPHPYLVGSDATQWDPTGNYLLGSINSEPGGWVGGNYWKFILDREGRVVWAHLTPDNAWSIYLRVSQDGDDILYDDFTYWSIWDEGAGSRVHRIKIDLSLVQTYDTPGGHHAFTELPDETLAWGAAGWDSETLERGNPDGTTETLWDCGAFHDSVGISTMCQSNALYWHEPTDSFLYSFYTTETVVEIDATTGETLRYFGHMPGAWGFDPEDSAFFWQHGVTYTDTDTLLVSTHSMAGSNELVVREYELDEPNETLTQVWSFGEGESCHGPYAGEAHRLPGGNTLHNFGSGALIREITPSNEIAWEVQWSSDRLLGRSVWLEDLYVFAP